MSAFPSDILITQAGGREAFDNIASTAKVLLAKNILKSISEGGAKSVVSITPEENKLLEDALQLIEFRCLDLSVSWRRNIQSNEGQEFRDYCSLGLVK